MKNINYLVIIVFPLMMFSCGKYSEKYEKKGDLYFENKQYRESIESYLKAFRFNKKNKSALHSIGRAYERLDDYKNAIKYYTLALEVDSLYALAYRSRGFAEYKLKEYIKALSDYDKSIKIDSLNSTAFSNSGFIYENICEYDKAKLYYQKAIQVNPNDYSAMNKLAKLEFDLRNYDSSIILCNKVIGHYNDDPASPYGTLGLVYIAVQKWDSSVVNLTKAIELNPDWSHYYNNRGYALDGLQKYSLALNDYNKAI
ncbi:MAG TPA: tetratricopeptide repeat protein [Bacteroidales bacterium]|nr:tetratricopeptide repeat protein [Bacteroidales bacterium]